MNIGHFITRIRAKGESWSPVSDCLNALGLAIDDLRIQIKNITGAATTANNPGVAFYETATVTPPTPSSTWTMVNGLTSADSVHNTLAITKSTAGLGLGLKPIATLAQFDVTMAFADIAFGNVTNSVAPTQDIGLFVTNGTVAGTSIAYGVVLNTGWGVVVGAQTTPNSGKVSRVNNPINVAIAAGVTAFQTVSPPLSTTLTWFRAKSNGSNIEFYIGDGHDWVLVYSVAFTPTHFGFGINPTVTGGTASSQVARVACSSA